MVQVDRVRKKILDEDGVRTKFGVPPKLIPDFLALVGDAADGYPGIPGIGKVGAARLLNEHGPIESFPKDLLTGQRKLALLFKRLATLRTDAKLFKNIDKIKWTGPTASFAKLTEKIKEPRLLTRASDAAKLVN